MTSRTLPLKRVATIRVSNVDKLAIPGDLPVRLCNYTDVYHRQDIRADQPFMGATATADQISAFGLKPGDVLITKDSETPNDIGVPAYVESSAPDLVCGYHLAVLRPLPDRIDGRFLYWSMVSTVIREQLALSATGVTRFGLRTEAIGVVSLPSFPLDQQRAIANFLDTETSRIDALVAKKRALAAALELRFVAAVQSLVAGGMTYRDPLGATEDDVPPGWQALRLGQDLQFGSGTTPTAGDSRFYGGDVPWVVTGNLRDEEIDHVNGTVTAGALAAYSPLRLHPAGALVVAMYGATVGRLGLLTFPATVNQACCVVHSGLRISNRYLFYYLFGHRPALLERSVGAGQPNISQEILRSLRIGTPPRSQQEQIVGLLDQARNQTQALRVLLRLQIQLLHERRQALITAAVTGAHIPAHIPDTTYSQAAS